MTTSPLRSSTPGSPAGSDAAALPHAVHFYENEQFLSAAVADFLAEGLATQEPVVIIARKSHTDSCLTRLRSKGIDTVRAMQLGRITILDAEETLAKFLVGGVPDRAKFMSVIGGTIDRIMRRRQQRPVRAYGEMVDILWQAGNTDGAVRLEELWNELARQHHFSLLCAYALGNFYSSTSTEQMDRVSQLHTHILPMPPATAEPSGTQAEVQLLRERARALELEIAHRKELEHRLRAALLARHQVEEALRRHEEELKQVANAHERLRTERPPGP